MLNHIQLEFYRDNGYLLLPSIVSSELLNLLNKETDRLILEQTPGMIYERNNQTVRALHGCHLYSEIFYQLIRNRLFLDMAEAILGSKVYLYQLKINMKQPLSGEEWPWHQDFPYWHFRDDVSKSQFINIAIYLDEVSKKNGPLQVIPCSHQLGILKMKSQAAPKQNKEDQWQKDVSQNLPYQVDETIVNELITKYGIVSTEAPISSILMFDGNIAHASTQNTSEQPRRMLILTYNRTDNTPGNNKAQTPEYLVSRDYSPL